MTHARLGKKAMWFCKDCFRRQRQGTFACLRCCGYTASATKVVRGVKGAHGQPNARCLP